MGSISCRRVAALALTLAVWVGGSDSRAASGTGGVDAARHPSPSVIAPTAPVLSVSPERDRQPIDDGVEVLEDASNTLDLVAVRARPEADWKLPARRPVTIGYSRSSRWLRVRLHNDTAATLQRLFEMGSPVQDYIDLSVVHGDGQVTQFPTLGDRVPFANRPVQSLTPTVPLTFAPRETVELYLRLSTHDGLHETLPLTLLTASAFDRAAPSHWFGSGLVCGLFGLLMIYNALLFLSTRNLNFFFYLGYLSATLLWRLTFSGDAFYLFWPEHPVFNNQILPLAVGAWFFWGLLFIAHHLRLREALPRVNLAVMCGAAFAVLASIPALFGSYALCFYLFTPLGLLMPPSFLLLVVVLIRRGSRRARWVLAGWLPLMACAPLYLMQLFGVVMPQWVPDMGSLLGFVLTAQMLVLGSGLIDDTNRWRLSLLASERRARLSLEHLAGTLESEVQQRTRALESANEQLRALTITDALTGVFNRRHFNECLETELARLQRQGDMPALCLLDVDHFKSYNDLYGHPKGDAALKAIASELKRQLRRAGDRVFRVGGEEFALLMAPGDIDLQREHIEGLRAAIQALQIPHAGNGAFGVITASFGLVQAPPAGDPGRPLTASALYREADRLLYRAKEAGRNCVVCDQRARQEWAPSTDFNPDTTQPAAP